MTFFIRGLATAVPSTKVPREDCERLAHILACPSAEQATWLASMYEGTGIHTRYVVFPWDVIRDGLNGTNATRSVYLPTGTPDDRGPTTRQRMEHYAAAAGTLAIEASGRALEQAQVPLPRVTHLVTVSCTGFAAPGFDVELIQRLRLPPTIERTQLGFMGCHGALNGLRVARAFTAANPDACVLLCAVELCSLHYHYGWDPQRMVANALFADGAAAVVGTAGDDGCGFWRVGASGSCVFPDSRDAMTWTIGDHGFTMTLSRRVPELIQTHLRPWLTRWLERQSLSLAEIASWAVHPGGPRILDAVEEALGLKSDATHCSREVLAEFGNMSSPTVLFILQRLQQQNAPRPCVALGFGPGLAVETALLR